MPFLITATAVQEVVRKGDCRFFTRRTEQPGRSSSQSLPGLGRWAIWVWPSRSHSITNRLSLRMKKAFLISENKGVVKRFISSSSNSKSKLYYRYLRHQILTGC
ncbi:MAG: hypothetical protein CSYNP_03663 [Syntrophus sp. SKADARSKE-3]|nr:hypothetical protein [Syntrophus sp. SKADARSKE-3]